MRKLKAVLAGKDDILDLCLPVLLARPDLEIAGVYTTKANEERLKARGYPFPVTGRDIKKDAGLVREMKPDLLYSIQYHMLVSAELIEIFGGRCYNFHFSLLPKYGGCYPVAWVLRNGESETGVTIHLMTPKFDEGEIIAQGRTPIDPDDDCETLHVKQVRTGFELFKRTVDDILGGRAKGAPQKRSGKELYYAKDSIDFERDVWVDWSKTLPEIHNQIRAFTFPRYQLPRAVVDGRETTIARTTFSGKRDGAIPLTRDGKTLWIGELGGKKAADYLAETGSTPESARFENREVKR
jgi:methionyl-tRNA formyltransferase